ncbi:helix-turn-helix domain-containing protein [Candidatus Thiodubiliella endoseptemdiera]|uniref:helix-turn-helix domain-containing protein n=1 Tax=Candidatus Thiodubiliella endoseptemdiera TaxID=2738886 RepID=UPI0034DF8FA0
MDIFASNFKKKFNNILLNEDLKPSEMNKETGVSIDAVYDYRGGRSGPSAQNLAKILKKFPQYTCYIFDLDSKTLPKQVFFK